ncbi:hypothetical protein MMC14_002102 [Varicellaria rhodocarpa]|nr:hypothetical protein [Varicellaria rhodocarpa]
MTNSSESTSTPPLSTPQSVPPSTDLHTSHDHDDSAAYQYGGDGKILGGTKLSFDNYVFWFKSLKFWAESRDCEWVYEYDSESVALRADTNPTRKRSRKRWNAKLMTMILAGADQDDQESIEDLDQACEAVKVLKEKYYGNAKRPVMAERHLQEYFNYRLKEESIEQAWSKLKRPRHRQGSSSSSSSSSSNRSNGSAVTCYLCDGDHLIHFCPHLAGAKKAIKKEKDKYKGKGKKDSDSSDSGENKKKSKHVSFEKLPSSRKSSKRSHSHPLMRNQLRLPPNACGQHSAVLQRELRVLG